MKYKIASSLYLCVRYHRATNKILYILDPSLLQVISHLLLHKTVSLRPMTLPNDLKGLHRVFQNHISLTASVRPIPHDTVVT